MNLTGRLTSCLLHLCTKACKKSSTPRCMKRATLRHLLSYVLLVVFEELLIFNICYVFLVCNYTFMIM
jgi:hypothetical protein